MAGKSSLSSCRVAVKSPPTNLLFLSEIPSRTNRTSRQPKVRIIVLTFQSGVLARNLARRRLFMLAVKLC